MRVLVVTLLFTAWLAPDAGGQAGRGAQAPRVKACALLTRELVTQVTPDEGPALRTLFLVPPQEDPVGPAGSSCEYGGINLQVDPFGAPERTEKDIAREWSRLPGVGDVAYFRDNRGMWAELYVRARGRVITVQMGVPAGRTAEAIKPNTIALAKAVLAKLK